MNYPCLRFTRTKKGSFHILQSWTDELGLFQILRFSQKIGCLKEKAMKKQTAWKLNRETSSYRHCVVCQPVGSSHLFLHWTTKVHKPLFRLACRLSIFVKREWWTTRNCLEALVSSNIVLTFLLIVFLRPLFSPFPSSLVLSGFQLPCSSVHQIPRKPIPRNPIPRNPIPYLLCFYFLL